ncbi:hypothetical protein DPMN_087155 [Dreissena polymorpha]|uniref:Uncharacterized protein n=1 Tax=Dreissena polymorpha TaxID=45954 RepID=A0A9D4QVC0_DREPO|nr:hypothetical protein DPMN_087155 [Dreissena polymorpha]
MLQFPFKTFSIRPTAEFLFQASCFSDHSRRSSYGLLLSFFFKRHASVTIQDVLHTAYC